MCYVVCTLLDEEQVAILTCASAAIVEMIDEVLACEDIICALTSMIDMALDIMDCTVPPEPV